MTAERTRAWGLCFVAGFVDTCVFVALFGLFTAHVTGNFVLIGAELVRHSGDVALKLLVFPAFIAGILCAVLLCRPGLPPGSRQRVGLLVAEAVLLLVAVACGATQMPLDASAPGAMLAALFAAGAMGVQNALMRLAFATSPSTTVMTINVTQSVIDAAQLALRRLDPPATIEARGRLARMLPQIAFFTIGAALGAFGVAWAGLASLALPALACLAMAAADAWA